MAFMTTDYSKNESKGSFEPLPQQEYEAIITQAAEHATPSGAESLQLRLTVRNDLDKVPALANSNAKFHNRIVFAENWKRKATHQYDIDSLQYILDAVGVPEGTVLNSMEDFINAINGKPVRVYVKQETDSYNGEDKIRNVVNPWGFKETVFPQVNHTFKSKDEAVSSSSPFAAVGQEINITDDDLPF